MSCTVVFLIFFLKLASSHGFQGEFIFDGSFALDGTAEENSDGLITLTHATSRMMGHVFYKTPVQFKNSSNGSVFSFSTTFISAIVPEYPRLGGHGLAFAISPFKDIQGVLPSQFLGLFNETGRQNSSNSNHMVAVELDTVQDIEFLDIDDNHVGIDIDSLVSIKAATAGYHNEESGSFVSLDLKGAKPIQVWVEYDGFSELLNVTIHPIDVPKPKLPLLSLQKDLSPYISDFMYVGFSSSSGLLASSHYILGWSFKMNGKAQQINLSRLPQIPQFSGGKEGYRSIKRMLAIILSLTVGIFLLVLIFGALFYWRRGKLIQVLEDWEVQYGPHRFTYKDLFKATKGFKDKQFLGRGGFGRVYRGILPSSNVEIAVKRISHDSKQGIREFIAEIATIGRLRHPNLVRLLGYCRQKGELFLVYDYMPHGSLDKFLYGSQPSTVLTWTQRFKIIKDVASALFYLHQQWVQVVIHGDIKPANVLIDKDMNARLGDFGLAKLCDDGNDPQTSHVVGTLGYIAPELARSGKATTGTDLYAFGVFMLEVACGRRSVSPRASPEEIFLIDWIMNCWDRGAILETVDHRLGNEYVSHEVELVLKLGLFCSHVVAAARPSMSSVVQFLDGASHLPENLITIIKSQDFGDDLGKAVDVSATMISIPPITLTESFASHGR